MTSNNLERLSRSLANAGSRRGAIAATAAVLASAAGIDRADVAGQDGSAHGGRGQRDRCRDHHSEREIRRFIRRAAKKYKQSKKAMLRVAECESNFDPCAVNRAGPYYGLYQYLESTWKTTPYGNKDIFDPKAQAKATAWMWKEGRKDEWACQ